MKFYNEIAATNTQGLNPGTAADGKNAYEQAFSLLANADEYDINLLSAPGLIHSLTGHTALLNTYAIEKCEDRGDVMCVIDPVAYAAGISDATAQAT